MKDIESNPGLSYSCAYKIKKAAQGIFHQGNSRFGKTAGIQYTGNLYFVMIFSAIKKIPLWKA